MTQLTAPPTTHPDFEAEAAHLSGTVHAIIRQIDAWEDRTRTNGADLETSMVMQDTAEEHAAMLSPHVHQPYFGALAVRIAGKTQALYVGNHAFKDLKGPHSVVSWESEVGGLFYAQTLSWQTPRGLAGTILRRRQLDVRGKVLHGVTDLYDAVTGETGGREAVLLKRLSEAATSSMRNVVETLQPEQNEILRASAGEHLCIQGPAGSGKTTMLYHRLAWLLHPERREHRARPEACMVLMPNQVLARYSARILPSLQLEGVTVTTPEAWATSFLGLEKLEVVDRTLTPLLTDSSKTRRKAAWRRARALGDLSMLRVVRQYLHTRIRVNTALLKYRTELSLPGRGTATLTLDTPALQALVEKVLARDPLEGLRPAIRSAIEETLAEQVRVNDDERLSLRRQLAADLTQFTSKIVVGLLPVMSARKLLSDEATLRQAAAGILPERIIQVLLSDPLAAVAKPRRSYADVTELPVMLAIAALLDGLGRRVGRELEPYDHLALDEAQDYSPLLYALLTRATRKGHITALGDKNQGIHEYKGVADFGEMQTALGSATLMTLSRTYRSTRQITELSSKVAQTYNHVDAVVGVDRDGEAVLRLTGGDVVALCAEAIKAMQQAGHMNIAVVTRRVSEAEQLAADLQYHDVDAQAITNEQARYQGQVVVLPVNLLRSCSLGFRIKKCVLEGIKGL